MKNKVNGPRLVLCVLLSLTMVLSGIPTQALDVIAWADEATTEATNEGGPSAGGDGSPSEGVPGDNGTNGSAGTGSDAGSQTPNDNSQNGTDGGGER